MTILSDVYIPASSLIAYVALCLLLSSCNQKERAQVELPNLSPSGISPLRSESLHDAPLVYHHDYGTTIHHLKRGPNYDFIAQTDTTLTHTPFISVYANSQFQFEVELRENHTPGLSTLSDIDTVLVSSDIEGNYRAFVSLLHGLGVIDASKTWTYNDNHLVLIGDMVDRGDEVLQVLWLIYKLEAEAESQGGGVHYILGNHEQLNLRSKYSSRNSAYVHSEYMRYAKALDIPYQEWFSTESELGRWLRSKNTVTSIDSTLFVHGGISRRTAVLNMSLQEINEHIRSSMDTQHEEMSREEALLHSAQGPLWYRELADQSLSKNRVAKILQLMHVRRMVVGHTIVDGHHIKPLYDDQVIPIDMHHSESYKKGVIKALMIDSTGFYEVDNYRQSKLLFLHDPIEI